MQCNAQHSVCKGATTGQAGQLCALPCCTQAAASAPAALAGISSHVEQQCVKNWYTQKGSSSRQLTQRLQQLAGAPPREERVLRCLQHSAAQHSPCTGNQPELLRAEAGMLHHTPAFAHTPKCVFASLLGNPRAAPGPTWLTLLLLLLLSLLLSASPPCCSPCCSGM